MSMSMTRRELLAACASTAALASRAARGDRQGQPLGVVIHSYGVRAAASRARGGTEAFDDAAVFLDYCHGLGARGVQVGIGARDEAACDRLRARAAEQGMDLEG